MTDSRFWSFIDSTRSADRRLQLERLKQRLEALQPKEIEAFEAAFDAKMKQSYSWDLWGAAYVAMGGASDDSFEYFRRWLISRGSDVFAKVVADPDALAAVAPADPEELEFEDIAYLAPRVWSAKTGRPFDEMPRASSYDPLGLAGPTGQPFADDEAQLARRYPRLSERFGPH